MIFQGYEEALIDGNGRVSFPLSFRKLIPEEKEFYISPGYIKNTLNLRRKNDYEAWVNRLPKTKEHYENVMKVMSNTRKVVLDEKQNRFLLPKNLKEYAFIDKDVVFAGNGDFIVISNPEKAAPYMLSKDDNFEDCEWML